MHIFKSKFFLICLCVVLCLSVFFGVLAATGYGGTVKSFFSVVFTPIRFVVNEISDSIAGFNDYFTEFNRLQKENDKLKEENTDLKNKSAEYDKAIEENENLKVLLDLKEQNPSYAFSSASVIGRSSDSSSKTLTLNKGSINGIKEKMPVITNLGLIGYISEVGLNYSIMTSIEDTSSSVGAIVEKSSLVGVIDGSYSKRLVLSYLKDENIKDILAVGDKIVSSGLGSVYPAGLVIGTINEIVLDEASHSAKAYITPFADYKTAKTVYIITGFDKEVKEADDDAKG